MLSDQRNLSYFWKFFEMPNFAQNSGSRLALKATGVKGKQGQWNWKWSIVITAKQNKYIVITIYILLASYNTVNKHMLTANVY